MLPHRVKPLLPCRLKPTVFSLPTCGSLAVCKLLEPGLILPHQLPSLACSPSGGRPVLLGAAEAAISPHQRSRNNQHAQLPPQHPRSVLAVPMGACCWLLPISWAPDLAIPAEGRLPWHQAWAEIHRGGHICPPAPPSSSHPLYSGQRTCSGWKPCEPIQRSLQVCTRGRFGPAAHKPSEQPLPRRCNFQADIKKQLGIGSHTLPHSTSSLLYE